jgi:hypothetical protein
MENVRRYDLLLQIDEDYGLGVAAKRPSLDYILQKVNRGR